MGVFHGVTFIAPPVQHKLTISATSISLSGFALIPRRRR